MPALQPSLLPLVDFLVNVFGWRLPQETCVSCEKKVLPDNPRHPSLKDPAHKDRPTRQVLVAAGRVGDILLTWSVLRLSCHCCGRACGTFFCVLILPSVVLFLLKKQYRYLVVFTTWPSLDRWWQPTLTPHWSTSFREVSWVVEVGVSLRFFSQSFFERNSKLGQGLYRPLQNIPGIPDMQFSWGR